MYIIKIEINWYFFVRKYIQNIYIIFRNKKINVIKVKKLCLNAFVCFLVFSFVFMLSIITDLLHVICRKRKERCTVNFYKHNKMINNLNKIITLMKINKGSNAKDYVKTNRCFIYVFTIFLY